MNDVSGLTVNHQQAQNRFTLAAEGTEAVLEYHRFVQDGRQMIDFTSTWVPPQHRGKGLAEKLVREGLKWARAEGLGIQASCWYVARFLRATDK
jgi:predicted GNAT family acetyltransferase